MHSRHILRLLAACALLCAATFLNISCTGQSGEVVIYTSVDQVFSEPVFRAFEHRTGLKVRAVFDTEETKSTGVLNRILAEASNPQADLFWSNDPVRPFVLAKRNLLAQQKSPSSADIPPQFKSPEGLWTGFAARARVLIVNQEKLGSRAMPNSILDLTDPAWKGDATIANPLYGTTTIHVAALFAAWGEDSARKFLDDIKTNEVRIASSNGEVKRLVVAGEVALGLTDTDDALEAMRSNPAVVMIYPDQEMLGTLILPTVLVALQKNNSVSIDAKRMMDFLLSPEVEQMLTTSAHMPLRAGGELPKGLKSVKDIRAMTMDYARTAIEAERIQPWLRQWVGV